MRTVTSGAQKVIQVERRQEIAQALALLDTSLVGSRRVLVLVGGAAQMPAETETVIAEFLSEHLVPVLARGRVAVVDGGTDSGVMRGIGASAAPSGRRFPTHRSRRGRHGCMV